MVTPRPGRVPRLLLFGLGLALGLPTAGAGAAACSGKPRPEGAGSSGLGGSGGSAGSAGSGGSGVGSASPVAPLATGEIQIRVEWADVPVAARASPGRTPCNTPRAASVAPTTTWGIPDAFVIVEGVRSDALEARLTLAECALSPRVAIGASLIVESAADRPTSVALAKRADLAKPEAATAGSGPAGSSPAGSGPASSGPAGSSAAGAPRVLRLPIAGHSVAVSLDAGGIYELATSDKDPETAWIIAPRPGAAVIATDATGQAHLRNILPGAHAVTAWLPPRAGQSPRIARVTVTVTAGQLVESSLPLASLAAP